MKLSQIKNKHFLLLFIPVLTYCGNNQFKGIPTKPTFTENIAPIIYKNCSPCHRKGGVGPFQLLTYNQVKKKAKTIARVTKSRVMPPWPADANYSHFVGEKYLTDTEIETIQRWYKQGAPEGPAGKLVAFNPPAWRSNIGKPDLVLALDSIQLLPDKKDRFFVIKIPGKMNRDTWVQAVEFIAGSPELVHHFNGHLLLYEPGMKKNVFDGLKEIEKVDGNADGNFDRLKLANDDGTFPFRIHSAVNYLPGVLGNAYPSGIGTFKLTKEFAFVGNDLHYGPSDKKVMDHSFINVFFTNNPPERETAEIMLGTNGVAKIEPPLIIAPNKVSKHTSKFTVTKDISILTINPHMHLLGKTFLAYAIKPNGDTIRLIRINNWDFRWQYFYTFLKMVPVPKGSVIVAEGVFDNTENNPNNPNHPPKTVGERLEFGGSSMRATDEMFQFIITYTMYKSGDENVSLSK